MLPNKPAIYTDFYELTMAQGYFLSNGHNQRVSFDYFFRKPPFNGGYVIFAGLSDFLVSLKHFTFGVEELEYLKAQGFKDSFLSFLQSFQFKGDIYSVKEGEVIFANEPILKVEGTILECQIIESLLLNILNFESLIATKASRIREVAGDKTVLDFGLRRAQGFGGVQASKAAVIGGVDGTSNVYSGYLHDLKVSGTMAHSWIQSHESEISAFRSYANYYPDTCVLLVDTYNTLESGVPNAIIVAKELEKRGSKLVAIRLDSGDLSYISKQARNQLDNAGLEYVKIAASNQLDEYLIKSLNDQKAPIDIFGVGTKLVTAYNHPALDGVYKLSSIDGNPTIKLSENVEKITLPASKKIVRYLNKDGSFYCDGILLADEPNTDFILHPHFPVKKTDVRTLQSLDIQTKIVENGKILINIPSATESAIYAKKQLDKLSVEHRRFDNPHIYKVGISKSLATLRDQLITKHHS